MAEVSRATRMQAGSCNFCSRAHTTVVVVRRELEGGGPRLEVRLCHHCVDDVKVGANSRSPVFGARRTP